jgi:hypothetical protein
MSDFMISVVVPIAILIGVVILAYNTTFPPGFPIWLIGR